MSLAPLKHPAGIVHEHGSQWCRRCGLLLRLPGAPTLPAIPGTKVSRSVPCRVDRPLRFKPSPDNPRQP